MNVTYINPFINASIEVFSSFSGVTATPGRPAVGTAPSSNGEVFGVIGLNGHGINGYFIINFSRGVLPKIHGSLFDNENSPSSEEINDLAGELTNMIAGCAKAELSQKKFFFDVAVPQISHTVPGIPPYMENTPVISVPFDTSAGTFHIEASIKEIVEDFARETLPEIPPPKGMVSVEQYSGVTGIAPVKIRRLLKTGFLYGKKISTNQWHIPETEIKKLQGHQKRTPPKKKNCNPGSATETISIQEYAKRSGLSSARIKSFLRSGFLEGFLDDTNTWQVHKDQVSKFNAHT
ncbi:MAG TPA: chemotaxis protein CheX [Desulfotignum sp.]|nr:chemotaxis protein CheX [Desulfotignum sp.]